MFKNLSTNAFLSAVEEKLNTGELWTLAGDEVEKIQKRLAALVTENQKIPIESQADQLLSKITSQKVERLLQSSRDSNSYQPIDLELMEKSGPSGEMNSTIRKRLNEMGETYDPKNR